MLVPRFWLHDHCHPELSTEELAQRLDLTGTKVERIYRHGVPDLRLFFDNDVRFLEQFGR